MSKDKDSGGKKVGTILTKRQLVYKTEKTGPKKKSHTYTIVGKQTSSALRLHLEAEFNFYYHCARLIRRVSSRGHLPVQFDIGIQITTINTSANIKKSIIGILNPTDLPKELLGYIGKTGIYEIPEEVSINDWTINGWYRAGG
jgi:hypothetical protein